MTDGAQWGRLAADGRHQACWDYGRDFFTHNLAVCDLVLDTKELLTGSAKSGAASEGVGIQPTISPSGRQIAYLWSRRSADGGEYELRIFSRDTAESRALFTWSIDSRGRGPGSAVPHDWTGDESQLLITHSPEEDELTLELVDIATGQGRELRRFEQVPVWPRLSPDGLLVMYSLLPDGSTNYDIYLLDTRSGAEWRLVEHPADDTNAIWSPSGDSIAFVSDRGGTRGLWRQQVTNGATGRRA